MKASWAAVQMIRTVVQRKMEFDAVDEESSVGDSIREPADQWPDETAIRLVFSEGVQTKHDIDQRAAERCDERPYSAAIGEHTDAHAAVILERQLIDGPSIAKQAKWSPPRPGRQRLIRRSGRRRVGVHADDRSDKSAGNVCAEDRPVDVVRQYTPRAALLGI